MDFDENDLLYSNSFIPQPELTEEVTSDATSEFRKFYEKEKSINEERRMKDNMSIRSIYLSEETDDYNIMSTNRFTPSIKSNGSGIGGSGIGGSGIVGSQQQQTQQQQQQQTQAQPQTQQQSIQRKTKEVITYVSIDSRDRQKIEYDKPSQFKIFLGRTFYNVKEIRLASMEFPNTNAVINTTNHHIYWRNKEDIDLDKINAITGKYPEYVVQLRIGSYIANTLQTEMTNKLGTVRRLDKVGDFHYFLISLDIDTDVVTFTSLILTQLSNNAIRTSVNTTTIEITANNHGFSDGEEVYLVGAKTIAGIPANTLNTKHTITVVNDNTFRFDINVKASETLQGGGNTLKTGKIAPFQFLFGEKSATVAPNIGYLLENSSDLINTYIKSISNLYQAIVVTKQPHGFQQDFNFIGQTCSLSGSNTSPNLDGNRRITQILSPTRFLVRIDNTLSLESFNNGQVTFGANTYDIEFVLNYTSSMILVTTFTDHNYTFSDIGRNITLYNTTTTPDLNDTYQLFNIFETNSFVIPGALPTGGESSTLVPGEGGSTPIYKPLTTHTVPITNFVINPSTVTLTCPNHNLQIGDRFQIFNIVSQPPITKTSVSVYSIPDSDTIIIDQTIFSFIPDSITDGTAYIGTGLCTLSFPDHGFNKIISITNTTGTPAGQTSGNLLVVQTQLPHHFQNDQLIRLSQTNTSPIIDGKFNVTVLDTDKFSIPYSFPITSSGNSGIIGYDHAFYLYGSTNVGGILSSDINNKNFTVRDIIDENIFTFYNQNAFASSIETGGGNALYISSLFHGFNGQQTNTKNSVLTRSINLQGENYAFLCCPQLSTMMNTGDVKNIFARITLDESPGTMVFSYLSNPKVFDTVPLNKLDELEFSIVNYDGTFYEFNDLDYSFTLQITEIIDVTDNFNMSSKRGIVDNT